MTVNQWEELGVYPCSLCNIRFYCKKTDCAETRRYKKIVESKVGKEEKKKSEM